MHARLLILDLPANLPVDLIPDQPFDCPGRIEISCSGRGPRWLPPAPTCVYLDPDRLILYRTEADGTPVKVGDLEVILFGYPFASRFSRNERIGVTFTGGDVERLAVCLEDDTQVDLPVHKARSALLAGEPITLTRDVLRYAIERGVEMVGKRHRRLAGDTLRKLFGQAA